MAANQTFPCSPGKPQESRGSPLPPPTPPRDSLPDSRGCDAEMCHLAFRTFTCSEDSDPVRDLRKLSELCRLWLRPDLHTTEQILDKLVLEQLMISMPLEIQVLIKDHNVQSCKDLEDILRRQEKPKTCTIVNIEGQKFLVQNSDVQMADVGVSDEHLVLDFSMKSRSFACEEEVHAENSREEHQESENEPETEGTAREQGQTALPLESIPEEGHLEDVRPTQMLEKDPVEGQEETTVPTPAEPQLPRGPEVSVGTESEENPPEGTGPEDTGASANSTHDSETDVLPQGRKRKDSPGAGRTLRSKRRNTSTPQDVQPEGAVGLEEGTFRRQLRSHSAQARSTAGATLRKETRPRTLSQCAECKKTFLYASQLTVHERSHTGERPFKCQVCPKKFAQPSDLRVHQRVHTGEKPYVCQTCGKSFAHESTLRGHQKVHTKERPYSCNVCQRSFSHKGNLNVHLRTHTGLKPCLCPQCGQAFRQLGTLRRHEKIHLKGTS